MTTKPGRQFISLLYNFIFVLVNAIIFSLFSLYFSLNLPVFVLGALTAFLLVGKISSWKSNFWFVAFFSLLFLDSPLNFYLIVGFLIASVAVFMYLIRRSREAYASPFKISGELGQKFLVALPRVLFFNISHELFPLLFIWLGITGALYFLGFVPLTGDRTSFIYIVTVSSIMLGFLQYYLKRYEEKVQKKITSQLTKQIRIRNRFSFDEFYGFVKERGLSEVEKLCRKVTEGDRMGDLMKILRMPRYPGKTIELSSLTVQLMGSEDQISQLRFNALERFAEDEGRKDSLVPAYSDFFEEKKREVLDELDREEIKRLSWTLLGSITILEESIPDLFSIRKKVKKSPETYSEHLSKTSVEILEEVVSIAMGEDSRR
jgi:hypothetical protein